jgi:hypothetical protein
VVTDGLIDGSRFAHAGPDRELAHENKSFPAEPNFLAELRRHPPIFITDDSSSNLCFLGEHNVVEGYS